MTPAYDSVEALALQSISVPDYVAIMQALISSLLISAGWPDWAFFLSLISAACLYFASILSLLGTPCC